jgi:DNA helicase II / ATP-dependent DNA helicase PcrA
MEKISLNYQQEFILDRFDRGESFLINAVAGSGKSTILKQICQLDCAKDKSILLVAFNKHVAENLEKSLPKNVDVTTLHALGLRLYNRLEGSFDLNSNPTLKLYDSLRLKLNYKDFEQYWNISRNFYPAWLPLNQRADAISKKVKDWSSGQNSVKWLEKAFALYPSMHRETKALDYTDMLFLPVTHPKLKITTPKYDVILVDELQDLNNLQLSLLFRIASRDTQLVFVGDPLQSIFGFSGAGTDNFPLVQKVFNIPNIYFSTYCYRCPESHIKLAQQRNPVIMPVKREIGLLEYQTSLDLVKVPAKSLIVAPTYALLLPLIFEALELSLPLVFKGVSCFNGIARSVKADGYYLGLANEYDRTVLELQQTPVLPSTQDRIRAASFKLKIIENLQQLTNGEVKLKLFLELEVDKKFRESLSVISTIHRAKGLENPNVFFVNNKEFNLDAETHEELKLNYVAITRSTNSLTLINL